MSNTPQSLLVRSDADHHKRRLAVGDDELSVIPLGAGCEVGRSCVLVEFKGRTIMFDCGIHPAHSGIGALPIFDAVNVENVDLCLITHFHLDHCGALPYFVAKTSFKGKVVMTEPTRAIAKLLWVDYAAMAKLSNSSGGREFSAASEYSGGGVGSGTTAVTLFDQADIDKTLKVTETIDFRETIDFKDIGVSVTAYAAGHVLGACMFCVEIAGVNILYTGDYSREIDRHVPLAEIPKISVHVLICESTYGIRIHEPRLQREKRFLDSVTKIVRKRGKCLLPVFALGRAQVIQRIIMLIKELLLMLEEHWSSHQDLQSVPIWYASPMSSRSMIVFETFINVCGDYVKKIADTGVNPFQLKYVKTARRLDDMKEDVNSDGPCVVMAAPGMLQSGTSRALFELWCHDKRNGVILTGYSLKGTLADELKKSPHTLQLSTDSPSVQIDSSFEMISFSAHSDFDQSYQFINELQCPNVVLVHGERNEAAKLSGKLKELKPSLAVFCPEVLQRVTLSFPSKRQAKCVGKLAETIQNAKDGIQVEALLVATGDTTSNPLPLIVSPEDAAETIDLPCTSLHQSITIEYKYDSVQPLVNRLSSIFDRLDCKETMLRVENRVNVSALGEADRHYLRLEWESDPLSDLVADTISFAALDMASTKASLLDTDESQTEPKTVQVNDEETDIHSEKVKIEVEADENSTRDNEILQVILSVLNDSYENIKVYERANPVDLKSTDTMISLTNMNVTSAKMEQVDINFSQRQISGSEELSKRIRGLLRRLEGPLLPLAPFEILPLTK